MDDFKSIADLVKIAKRQLSFRGIEIADNDTDIIDRNKNLHKPAFKPRGREKVFKNISEIKFSEIYRRGQMPLARRLYRKGVSLIMRIKKLVRQR